MDKPAFSKEKAFDVLSIFDWGFKKFVTVSIVKVLYILGIIAISFMSLALVIFSFQSGFAFGLTAMITVPILFAIWVLSLRVYLELIVALFRIAENTTVMAERVEARETTGVMN